MKLTENEIIELFEKSKVMKKQAVNNCLEMGTCRGMGLSDEENYAWFEEVYEQAVYEAFKCGLEMCFKIRPVLLLEVQKKDTNISLENAETITQL